MIRGRGLNKPSQAKFVGQEKALLDEAVTEIALTGHVPKALAQVAARRQEAGQPVPTERWYRKHLVDYPAYVALRDSGIFGYKKKNKGQAA